MAAINNTQQVVEEKLVDQAQHVEQAPVQRDAFNRRHAPNYDDHAQQQRRLSTASIQSLRKNFDTANIEMVLPVQGHVEISDDYADGKGIDDIAVSWFVWLVAATASIAGALFGYDTG